MEIDGFGTLISPDKLEWIELRRTFQRRTGYLHQHIDRHTARVLGQIGQRLQHAGAIATRLTHTDERGEGGNQESSACEME